MKVKVKQEVTKSFELSFEVCYLNARVHPHSASGYS